LAITGPETEGWIPVLCGDIQPGYVSADFVQIGGEPPLPPTEPATIASEEAVLEPVPTAEPVVEEPTPTAVPVKTPIPVQRTADSEESGTAFRAVDADPDTIWSVYPNASPDEVWLLLDLGEVRPVDRLTFELGRWNTLPRFEIWLSEDGDTWHNASQWNGWNLEPDRLYEAPFGLWTRYVMIVVPDADESGLSEIGGFREIAIWPAEQAQQLDILGAPTTPEPLPTKEPTPEPVPEESQPIEPDPEPTPIGGETLEPEPSTEDQTNGT